MVFVALLDRLTSLTPLARAAAAPSGVAAPTRPLPSLGRARRTARVALIAAGARLGLYAAPLLVVAALGAGPWIYGYAAALAAAAVFAGAVEQRAARRAAQGFGYSPRAVRHLVAHWNGRALAAALAGTLAGAAFLVGVEPGGLPLDYTLTAYGLFAVVIAAAALGGLASGTLVAAGRVDAAVGSHAIRATAALAGAAAACAVAEAWPLALGLAAGEVARTVWLHRRLDQVLRATGRRSGAPLDTAGRASGGLVALAAIGATGLLSHLAWPAAALLSVGDLIYAALVATPPRR